MADAIFLLVVFVLLFGTIFAGWSGATDTKERTEVVERLSKVRDRFVGKPDPDAVALTLKREDKKSRLDMLAGRFLPNPDHWRQLLARTGTNLTIGKVAIGAAVFGLVLGLALTEIGIAPIVGWPSALAATIFGPRMLINYLVNRRATRFIAVFPDAVGLMVRGLRAGLPVTETVIGVTREIGDPVGSEFRRIADQIQLGQPLEEALWESAGRIDLPEFTFMAIAFSIQRETGGNLAETLDNLDQILRRRRQLHLKIRTFSAEARASATIIGALPFVVMGILAVLDFDYIAVLFNSASGHMYLTAAMSSLAIGVFAMIRMGKFRI
ncbi:MAG: type II secretion system F family protein [Alphaproteobacteria bacterium]|nr:type II secretion system F family protein [Alphaproteobacteria bacterium]